MKPLVVVALLVGLSLSGCTSSDAPTTVPGDPDSTPSFLSHHSLGSGADWLITIEQDGLFPLDLSIAFANMTLEEGANSVAWGYRYIDHDGNTRGGTYVDYGIGRQALELTADGQHTAAGPEVRDPYVEAVRGLIGNESRINLTERLEESHVHIIISVDRAVADVSVEITPVESNPAPRIISDLDEGELTQVWMTTNPDDWGEKTEAWATFAGVVQASLGFTVRHRANDLTLINNAGLPLSYEVTGPHGYQCDAANSRYFPLPKPWSTWMRRVTPGQFEASITVASGYPPAAPIAVLVLSEWPGHDHLEPLNTCS